uniref:Uncharacterized protein n=1 Tax=Panagrolaimus superbus TaxID=310955 RepID=A0A914Y5J3_9BILA
MTVDFGNETGIYANDTTFILHYADHMSELLKSFCKCRFNSAVLLTNRIVNITSESTLDFTDIISYSCTEFTTILLGRNDADYNDTLNLLKETYGVIRDNMADKSTVFNVPDYSCLGYLTTCISPCQTSSSLSCDGIQLDNCLANTTTTTTTITTTATTATTTTAPSTTSTATTTATAPSTASSTTTATATPPEVYILLIFIQIYFYYSQRFW